jgi:hypothetical protein
MSSGDESETVLRLLKFKGKKPKQTKGKLSQQQLKPLSPSKTGTQSI